MPTNLDEAAFEEHICAWLVEHGGYADIKRGQSPPDYDAASGLDTAELLAFIGATQGAESGELLTRYGNDAGKAQRGFVAHLSQQLDTRGTVDVLRHGVEDLGVSIRLAFFKPASGFTPELQQRYAANRLTVTRQLAYDGSTAARRPRSICACSSTGSRSPPPS